MSNKLKSRPRPALAPPTKEGRAVAQRHVEEAFEVLLEIMRDTTAVHATRLRAAQTVIERAWGRVAPAARAAAAGAAAAAAVTSHALPVSAFVNVPELSKEEWLANLDRMGAPARPAAPGHHGAGGPGAAVRGSGGGR